jgi:hypothetical protein
MASFVIKDVNAPMGRPQMNMDNERQRTLEASIERLRQRAKRLANDDTRAIVVVGILLGILDLLGDEL